MAFVSKFASAVALAVAFASPAQAATCGNTSAGFNAWKAQTAQEAAAKGIGQHGLSALAGTTYAKRTIAADRNQKSFKYTLEKFMQVRGSTTIVAQGRKRLAKNPGFYTALEKR
jgi:membrane-bound lytic murein transglycosylase B